VNSRKKRYMKEFEVEWQRLSEFERLLVLLRVTWYRYKLRYLLNAITAGLIGGLLFTTFGGSYIIAVAVGVVAGYYTLIVSLYILPVVMRRRDDKDAGRLSR
jgi:hypothetical protein